MGATRVGSVVSGRPSLLPAIEAAVEQEDLEHAHDPEHPPDARRRKKPGPS